MILAILQARVSSTRLPGKVLKDLAGKPMILRQIERINASRLIDKLVVATSVDASDDALVKILQSAGIETRRGPLDDVIERFSGVIEEFRPETIVRLTADCPLTDPLVIDSIIEEHLETESDYTSNTLEPTYPDGLDVECISAEAFNRLRQRPLTVAEREHVTMGLYSNPSAFKLTSVRQAPDLSSLRWTVDVADDLEFVRVVYSDLFSEGRTFGQSDILVLLEKNPDLSRTDLDVGRNSGLKKL